MCAESQWIILLCKLIYVVCSYFTMIVLKDIYIYYSEVLFTLMAQTMLHPMGGIPGNP